MSEDQLKAFIAKVHAESSLQEQLKAEGADVVAIAKAAGFSISTEDLKAIHQDISEYELEGMAGGRFTGTDGYNCGLGPGLERIFSIKAGYCF